MEQEAISPLLEDFLLSPLVCWVKTVSPLGSDGSPLSEFMTLVDGVYLNDIMTEINPKSSVQRAHRKVRNEPTLRIHNLSLLVQQIKSCYQETLQQLVVMSLPDVLVLGRTPLSEQGLEEMRKILLLLLGCAVQCNRKEEYIDRIQMLDFDTQAAIAAHIQEVTHNQENVFDLQCVEESESVPHDKDIVFRQLTFNLKRLVDERDQHAEMVVSLSLERDAGLVSLHTAPSPGESPSIRRTESVQHLSVELADAKARIRRLRQELEEKTEQLLDCRQELEHMETEVKRLQQENLQLLCDARSLRAYRDELDALREKAVRVDKLESEVTRYKEKLHDIEFYRTRVEELKEDYQVLLETKSMLEDQLESFRARSDKHHELEKENLQLKNKIHDMEMERDMDRKRMEELLEENLTLAVAQKQSMDESLHLGWELEQLSKTTPELTDVPQKSLGHEVNELTSSQLLKLEKENQMLLKNVEELKSSSESGACLRLEKDNQTLSQQLEQLQAELTADRESLRSAESLSTDLLKEKGQLEKTLETLQQNSDRQVKGLEQENDHLNQTIASLRQRSQVSAEARVKDIEKENRVLHESIKETSSKLNKMEFERKQLRNDLEHYKEKGERAEELEMEVHRLEREKESLQKRLAALSITCGKVEVLEKENAELEAESRKLKKAADGLRNVSYQLEVLEKENTQLDEENLALRRMVESLRSTGAKAAQLELENKELESERTQLKKSLELLKASSKKNERLEVSYQSLDAENQRLQKALESGSRKIQQLEGELQDTEMENQSLQQSLEELKISSKGLEQLAQENMALEQENNQLERDKKQLEKENKRLRQQAEIKDSRLDEDNLRISHLEKENRTLGKELTALKDTCGRIKDLEKDNKELVKQATIDKRTLVTLREELVNEKLKTQQINNDLEKLTHELEKIGLDKEGLLGDEESSDDRFKLLECKLESTLKSSLEIKVEKIAALEARLQESSNLNQQLRHELKTVKKNYEALRQRQEEECSAQSSPARGREDTQSKWEKESQEATRELLKLKDRLIEVERNNATLQAEKQALRTQLKQLESQSGNLQAQILALQRQTASLQENNTTLQTQNAKLQVENSTLNSQSAALMSQNAQLQTQQSGTESERDVAIREKEELRSVYDLLLHDHEKLSALHERQASEYEDLIGKHGELKSGHKSLELQHRSLENRYNQLLKQKTELEQLERELTAEREKMISDSRSHQDTAAQYQRLGEEHHTLSSTHQQLLKDNELLQTDHKSLKSQLNTARLEQTRLEAEFSKLKEQYQQLDITSTKLTNQCELLSQLKGNLEEENRHLLDQIQTLMLQNRTLLEQTMESKDLFHVEQRQYIDKLNELRRQKEKLEEKIMDQYKFYDPSPPRRRGNWIALKMRKLIKPKSRERMRSLTQTPSRSESSEGFLMLPQPDSQDSSSIGSGSNSLEDNLTHHSSTLKKLAFMRNRSKEKDQVKAVYRRSMSMNDLLQTMAVSGGQWSSSTDHLEAPDEAIGAQHGKEFGSMDYSGLSLTHGRSARLRSDTGAAVSSEDVTQSSWSERAQGVMNGSVSRPHSESSDLSVSLDSPATHSSLEGKHRATSAGSEVVSLQQFLEESTEPAESSGVSRERVKSRGILRSASSKASAVDSARAGQPGRPSLRKAESSRSKGRAGLSAQSKASSASLSERLDSSAGLPRASSVISTAEGSVRRTSIHELLSKDSRQPVLVDPAPARSQSEYSEPALHKSTSMPCRVQEPQPSSLQAFLGPSFTVDSIFLDSIFSEPAVTGGARNQTILSLNTALVSNISGPPHKAKRSDEQPAEPEPDPEDGQSLWYEYGCV
ncbi:girdin-like isoform X2 [Carassius carassius]|uniref:girdin-like isoform X2 n=1 Tax=Carassius carassius TaxID=217509 RepID=UPI0028690C77|nr:girdin-like isoform X2 [Carassius carassius]